MFYWVKIAINYEAEKKGKMKKRKDVKMVYIMKQLNKFRMHVACSFLKRCFLSQR